VPEVQLTSVKEAARDSCARPTHKGSIALMLHHRDASPHLAVSQIACQLER
jgi:hypothetical protein